MNKLIIALLFVSLSYGQESYKSTSGIIFKEGDTLRIGSPLSHLGWKAIFKDKERTTLISNKNFIDKEVVVKSINTNSDPVSLSFLIYRKEFYINIDDALANNELIPKVKLELANNKFQKKYELLKTLKDFLDNGTITKEEYQKEKTKILNQ
ncbi:SHOCT domain-containing protein [Lacinutrix sp. C3R15]|uniref:SHOCT domain-containing protein n=1 Tax=Flavobacteriaceae TaxID=49546 RepID=UPI001C09D176|nr:MULTISPECIES: SHOCT domain-containing protein [Flavobacteriaceae]MBU2939686.1 SHOCT domain-containing protein [Lacinutrix sp. C3R15]MDO6623001.1 SHOCT domain-containing protein [Oceanihabitans sp. 1_MG-2023]